MTYVSGLPGSSKLDGHASAKENAQRTAWKAHAASALGELVVGVNLLSTIRTQSINLHSGTFILLIYKLLEARPTDTCQDDAHSATILCTKPHQGNV